MQFRSKVTLLGTLLAQHCIVIVDASICMCSSLEKMCFRTFMSHLGIIEGLSLGASVGSGVHGVLAKHAKFSGHTTIMKLLDDTLHIQLFNIKSVRTTSIPSGTRNSFGTISNNPIPR
jgi:hypothetical protein